MKHFYNNTCSLPGTASPAVETSLPIADDKSPVAVHSSSVTADGEPVVSEKSSVTKSEPDLSRPYCEQCSKEYKNNNGYTSCCGRKIDFDEWLYYEATFGPPPESLRAGKHSRPVDPMLSREKTSHYRGVSRSRNLWRVLICRNGRQYSMGRYQNELTAAQVFDNATFYLTEAGHIKPYLRLNFPEDYTTSNRPGPFLLTTRLIRRFDLERVILKSQEAKIAEPNNS